MSQTQTFPVDVLSVHDGDTLHVCLRLPLPYGMTFLWNHPLRLEGVNCPELSTPEGVKAKLFAISWLGNHPAPYSLQIEGEGKDKYWRLLGYLIASDGANLSKDLLASAQAVPMKVERAKI